MAKQTSFAKNLLRWHHDIDRKLPWKADQNPYKIWLSEIIMQQTRVAQGTPYYLKFVEAFPTIVDLANADTDLVMKLWQGLGYYSRARNLHHAAKTVRDDFGGEFPDNYNDVLSLKGVGKYTAAAIVSFAYGEEKAVVDGNVIRVISRFYGITEAVDQTVILKDINKKADQLIRGSDPAAYNQAIMDFGALYCKPKNPNCMDCVFSNDCSAYEQDIVSSIPFKAKKIKKKTRYLHYFVIKDNEQNTVLKYRQEKDIWQSLYDFPCIEKTESTKLKEEEIYAYLKQTFGIETNSVKFPMKSYKHILTHQTLYGQFYQVGIDQITACSDPYSVVTKEEISEYAMPVLITNYLNEKEGLTLF